MSTVDQKKSGKKLSRRSILKAGTAAGLAVMAGAATPKLKGNGAVSAMGAVLTLGVRADLSQFDQVVTSNNNGPFYVPGDIVVPDTTDKIGDFHCWGFFYNEGASGVVCQEYNLTGRGKIQVQGVEDDGPRAVTGGTGQFLNVRGEMTGSNISSAFPNFTVTFRFIGARGR